MRQSKNIAALVAIFLLSQLIAGCSFFAPEEGDPPTITPLAEVNDPTADAGETVNPTDSVPAATEIPTDTPEPTSPPTPTIEASILTTSLGDPTPRLIGQNPSAGDGLEPSEPLELYFDQPMNPDSTAAAFRFLRADGVEVRGDIEWPQPRVLRFQPSSSLALGTLYTVSLAETATAATGKPLLEGLTLDVYTIGPLEVSQVVPSNGTVDVETDSAITVIFNRPVVPLVNRDEQDNLPNPLRLSPNTPGIGRWLNTSVYVWRPTAPLAGRSTYNVTVDANRVNQISATGARLEADVSWQFTVVPPTINRLSLPGRTNYARGGDWEFPLEDQPLRLVFNQSMDQVSTERAISFSSEFGSVPLVTGWNEQNTAITMTPTVRLAYDTLYTLDVLDEALSSTGGRLRAPYTWTAKTVPAPAIEFTKPSDGTNPTEYSNSFEVHFASRMDRDTLADNIIFDPPLEQNAAGEVPGYYYSWGEFYSVFGLKPSTDYTVTILPGMADPYGTAIDESQTISFRTAARTPFADLQMNFPFALYRQNGTTAAWVKHINVDELTYDIYQFDDPLDFFERLESYDAETFNPNGLSYVRTQTANPATAVNEIGYTRFDLVDPNGNMHPPGFYFITANSPDAPNPQRLHDSARPIMIANGNLTLKTTSTEALMWLTSLDTGEPISGIEISLYTELFREVATGVTDEDGMLYLDGLDLDTGWQANYIALTNSDSVLAASITNWNEGVNPWDFGINADYGSDPVRTNAYLYTDRPLYRPGHEVFFKGIIREDDDLQYEIPAIDTVTISMFGYEGQVFREQVDVGPFGTFEGGMTLDEEAVLGTYVVNVETTSGDFLGSGQFDVAEFRKPTYQVVVEPAAKHVLEGEPNQATVKAEFFSGGAVANAEVFWRLYGDSTTFDPGDPNLSRYRFGTDERDIDFYRSFDRYSYGFGTQLASGKGTTDANGELVVDLPEQLLEDVGTQKLTLEATVNDIAGNQVSGRGDVVVHPGRLYAGIKTDAYIGVVGEVLGFDMAVVDVEGDVQSGVVVDVEVVERRWSSVEVLDTVSGLVRWESTVEEIPVAELVSPPADEQGRTAVTFTPETGGVYRAYATVADTEGNLTRTSTFFWVSGGGYVPWRRINDHSFEVIPDADSYAPGDTAQLLIASPFQGVSYAMITVERGHIYQRDVIRLDSNSTLYELSIDGSMAPNMYVSVLVMKGVDEFSTAPDFKVGYAQFDVSREEQELTIEILPDETVLGPQDTVNYTVKVTDSNGAPVEAELSLALVDKALLALKTDPAEPLIDFFYYERSLSVATALLLTKEMDSFNEELQAEIKGGGGGGGDFGVITVREEFKDTAHWTAQITTDRSGEAQISVELPDNLTTWRLDVRAVTKDTKVGQAVNDIVTTKPLLVSPLTPRFFVVDDVVSVGTIIRNTTDEALDAEANIDAEGVELLSDATRSVTIEPNQSAAVYWEVEALPFEGALGRADFVFAVRSADGEFEDASRPTLGTLEGQGIPIYKYEVIETVGTSGQLLDGGVAVESIGLPVYDDDAYVPTQGELIVNLSPSLAAAMTDGLDYLEHYPYECTEQIVSKFLPNVLSTQALNAAGITNPELEAELKDEVNVALQKLYARQFPNGGWPWWDRGPGARPNPLVTAYVVLSLMEAREAGYAIRDEAISSGLNYLKENVSDSFGLDERFRLNRQAFMLYVLAEGDLATANTISALYENRQSLDIYARAYLARAMHLTDSGDPRINVLLSDFNNAAIFSATGTKWEEAGSHDVWNWNTDTRTTAIVMGTLAKIDNENPLVANSVRWLMAHRQNGHWQGTQETAWTLMALTDWMIASDELNAEFEYEVALNGELSGYGVGSRETLRDPLELKVEVTDLLTEELNRLAIGRSEGPGNLYYSAHLRVGLPVPEIEARDDGIMISRQYFDPDDPETPIEAAAVGDTVMVRLSIVAPNTLHYVGIEDWLPAGLEAIDTSLATSEQGSPEVGETGGVRTDVNFTSYYASGWGWWYFDHVQLRDEKVIISADWLPRGTYEYVYLARAATPGTYSVIPPRAEQFYFPEVSGRGDGMSFVVYPLGTTLTQDEVAVDEQLLRIVFAPNESAGEVQGLIDVGDRVSYLLGASEGQEMSVEVLSPGSNVAFSVLDGSGNVIGTVTADRPRWTGLLPETGDYKIELRAVGDNAGYVMTVRVE
ncbi:MAG: Ig-like domain-containing protein [Chloroflexota bacterium]